MAKPLDKDLRARIVAAVEGGMILPRRRGAFRRLRVRRHQADAALSRHRLDRTGADGRAQAAEARGLARVADAAPRRETGYHVAGARRRVARAWHDGEPRVGLEPVPARGPNS